MNAPGVNRLGAKLLLDTHALVWWWTDDCRLPQAARQAIADPATMVLVSAASAWEIATKQRLGKWPEVDRLVTEFEALIRRSRFAALSITHAHAQAAGALAGPHRDPFDRMLLAQSKIEDAAIVSADAVFAGYGVPVVWA